MNRKLKIALKRRNSEQGFALPVAIGMGLIMVLVGLTMILRSQDDQVTASAQKATARSLATAETGTTRVQSLLNTYRSLASVTLTNIAGTPPSSSWKQAYNASGACSAGGGTTEIGGYRLNEWVSLDSKEKFRVTEYTYRPNSYNFLDGSAGPRDPVQISISATIPLTGFVVVTLANAGYLTSGNSVEGQIKGVQGTLTRNALGVYTFTRLFPGTATLSIASGDTFSPTKTNGIGTLDMEGQVGTDIKATSHLEVSIPVQTGNINNVRVPGAFIKSGGTGNNTVQGNVLLSDCSASIGDVKVTGTDPTGVAYKAEHTSMTFPTLPTPPTIITSPNNQNLVTLSGKSKLTLPRSGDKATNSNGVVDPNGVYRYSVASIDDGSIIITPGKKVTFYLAGNISKKGGDIQHTCVGFTSEDSNSNGGLDSGEDKNGDGVLDTTCKPTDFQIFGSAPVSTPKAEICLNGNDFLEAFIFAPNYQAGVAGGGGGKGGFKGSIWVNNWSNGGSCGSNTSNVVVVQTANWTDLGLIPANLPPVIAPISSWQRQEAGP